MHVLFYTPYFAHKGGIEKIIAYLTNHLVGNKIAEVSILNEDPPSMLYYSLPDQVRIYCRNFTPFTEKAKDEMRELIMHINPTVVVVLGSSRHLYKVGRSLMGLPYPVVLSEHNADTQIVKAFRDNYDFLNAVRRVADINHVLFKKFSNSFPDDLKDNVRIIPNPIFESKLRCDPRTNSDEPNIIIHVGRYDLDQKQQHILIKSFALIANKYPNWQVRMYGSDWRGGEAKLKKFIQELGLSNQVFLMGPTDNPELEMSLARIMAFPSKYEGFGLVIGEAMSVGLPSIAYRDCDGVNELIIHNETGLLIEPLNDVDKFSEGLEFLISNEEKRISYSKNSINAISRFSPEKFLSDWVSMINEAAKQKGYNILLNLSPIEQDYMRLVTSGYLFNRINKKSKDNNLRYHIKSIGKIVLKDRSLYNPMKKMYSKLRTLRKSYQLRKKPLKVNAGS